MRVALHITIVALSFYVAASNRVRTNDDLAVEYDDDGTLTPSSISKPGVQVLKPGAKDTPFDLWFQQTSASPQGKVVVTAPKNFIFTNDCKFTRVDPWTCAPHPTNKNQLELTHNTSITQGDRFTFSIIVDLLPMYSLEYTSNDSKWQIGYNGHTTPWMTGITIASFAGWNGSEPSGALGKISRQGAVLRPNKLSQNAPQVMAIYGSFVIGTPNSFTLWIVLASGFGLKTGTCKGVTVRYCNGSCSTLELGKIKSDNVESGKEIGCKVKSASTMRIISDKPLRNAGGYEIKFSAKAPPYPLVKSGPASIYSCPSMTCVVPNELSDYYASADYVSYGQTIDDVEIVKNGTAQFSSPILVLFASVFALF